MKYWFAGIMGVFLARELLSVYGISEALYWKAYFVLNDLLLILVGAAVCRAAPLTPIYIRPVAAVVTAMFAVSAIQNGLVELKGDDALTGYMIGAFIAACGFLVYMLRYLAHFNPEKCADLVKGQAYLIVYPPTSFKTLLVAFFTGVGGSFAETDGERIWKFSKTTLKLEERPYRTPVNAMIIPLGVPMTEDRIEQLRHRVNEPFSIRRNCLTCFYLLERKSRCAHTET